jgi:uncharacterized protein (TIGR03437 family)
MADDGRLYAWYHYERPVCDGSLTAPVIGALRSSDNGATFEDLGIILEATPGTDCTLTAADFAFAGGNGDFSIMVDRSQTYIYILYTNYAVGPASGQGICVARMAYGDRDNPAGKVTKFYNGTWGSPGLGGSVTPIFPAATDTRSPSPDFMWGPSIHWNTYLNQYVMLLNHLCCTRGYPQEGIYITFNKDVANPLGWSQPVEILAGSKTPFASSEWYPQLIGLDTAARETDKLAGRVARFYVSGKSTWEIVFSTPLTIATQALSTGTTGVAYSQALAAAGGTPPYRWSVSSGALPPGLGLDAPSGRISGVPAAAGGFSFTVQVTDSAGASVYQSLSISIVAGVSISTASLAGGTVGVPYSQVLAAAGGTPPYRWSVSSGALAAGLGLDPAGAIGGTPSAAGTFSLTIQVTDSGGGTASRAFAVTIAPAVQPLKINTPAALPGGATGSVYLQTFSASGGTPPYNWSLTSGSLPLSLQFNASGILTGTPIVDGNFTFTVQVADAAGATASQSFSLTVAPVAVLADAPMLNGASFQAAIAPGAIVSIFGAEMALGPQSASAAPLPTNLNGTSVLFNGTPLPLFYVSTSQVNAQVPFEVAAGQAAIALVRGTSISAVKQVTVSPVSPGIFTVNQSGSGAGVVTHANFSLVNASSPAKAGEYLSIFCTGLGALQPPVPTGGGAPVPPPLVTASVTAAIGGVPAQVTFAGAAPGFVGLYQVNVQVAPGTPPGSQQPLELRVNGLPGNTVTVAVQ